MNKKILIGSIIAVAILVLSSLGVIAYTSEETPFALSESSVVIGNLPRVEEEIHYYNPDTLIHVIGLQEGELPCYWSSAIRLTQDELAPWAGWELVKVLVFLSCNNGQSEVWANLTIYGEGTPTKPGEIIYQDTGLYFNKTNYYKILLDEPISISEHNEIWIAMTWKQTEEGACIAIADDGPAVDGKGDWVAIGGSWSELQNHGGLPLDYNWGMGAIVSIGGKTELSIINIKGPIGVNAEVKNIGENDANNLEYTMTVTGGILGMINKTVSDTITELAPDETIPIYSGFIFGLGPITINVTAKADNAYEDSITKTGFIIGPFVFLG